MQISEGLSGPGSNYHALVEFPQYGNDSVCLTDSAKKRLVHRLGEARLIMDPEGNT